MEHLLVHERQATVAFSEQADMLVKKFQSLQRSNDLLMDHNNNLQDFIKEHNIKQ